jgi:hypothetical protein
MDIRIAATYAATDGRTPESVNVTLKDVQLGADTSAALASMLDVLLMAGLRTDGSNPSALDMVRRAWGVRAGADRETGKQVTDRFRDFVVGDATDLAEQMRQDERDQLQPVREERFCLRMNCGHSGDSHTIIIDVNGRRTECSDCLGTSPCPGFVGTMPARLTSAVTTHRGEMLAADTDGYVRRHVDVRAALMPGSATEAFKQGDALEWVPPVGSRFGMWNRKDAA